MYLCHYVVSLVNSLLLVKELHTSLFHHLLQPREALTLEHHPLVDLLFWRDVVHYRYIFSAFFRKKKEANHTPRTQCCLLLHLKQSEIVFISSFIYIITTTKYLVPSFRRNVNIFEQYV